MRQEHTHQPTPEQAAQGEWPPAEEPANGERDRQRQHRPEQEGLADEGHNAVAHEMTAIYLRIGIAVAEDPAEVRVEEAFDGAVRVALTVGARVMFGVGCRPLNSRTLE